MNNQWIFVDKNELQIGRLHQLTLAGAPPIYPNCYTYFKGAGIPAKKTDMEKKFRLAGDYLKVVDSKPLILVELKRTHKTLIESFNLGFRDILRASAECEKRGVQYVLIIASCDDTNFLIERFWGGSVKTYKSYQKNIKFLKEILPVRIIRMPCAIYSAPEPADDSILNLMENIELTGKAILKEFE